MDSLDAGRYYKMTKGDLGPVLTGIDEALQADLQPVRINVVLLRGRNSDEVDDFIALTRTRPLEGALYRTDADRHIGSG